MSEGDLTEEVRGFIARHLTSVVQLETLLLLHAAPAREWSADEVAASLRIDPAWAHSQMEGLCQQGLAARAVADPELYSYAPHDEGARSAVAALAKAYLERRVTVIALIFSHPAEPQRPDGVRAFADAFRLRRDKDKNNDKDKDRPNG